MRSQRVHLFLAALLAIAAGFAAAQEVPAGCACTNNPPDDEYTCDQQKEFGKCESDWMIEQNLCAFTCGLCECVDDAEATKAAALEVVEEEDAEDPVEVEDDEEVEDEDEIEDEEPAPPKKPTPSKKPSKSPPKKTPPKPPATAAEEEEEEAAEDEDEEAAEVEDEEAAEDEEEEAVEDEEEGVVEDEEEEAVADEEEEVVADEEEEVVADEEVEDELTEAASSDVLLVDFEDAKGKCAATVYEALDGSDDTSLFSEALDAAELGTLLNSDDKEYTIFVPTNEALEDAAVHLGVELNDLLNLFVEKLTTIVKYHIVEGVLEPEDLQKPDLIPTLADSPLIGGSSSEIEGLASSAKITGQVPICDSMVYLVDSVLLPAAALAGIDPKDAAPEVPTAENIPTCTPDFDGFFSVSEDPELSTFTEALNRYGLSKPLADTDNKYTLFAPTNSAFEKLAKDMDMTLDELLEDEATVPGILENHILSDMYEGPDLLAERSLDLKTQNGSIISLETNSKGTLVDLYAQGSSAKVIDTDIDQSCESAVHKVSNVLLPFSLESEGTGVRGISVPQTASASKPAPPAKSAAPSGACQVGDWSIFEVLNQMSDLSVFTAILSQAGLTPFFTNKDVAVTIFAPVNYAFGNILPTGWGYFDLVPEEVLAQNLISNHIVGKIVLGNDFEDGLEMKTALTLEEEPLVLEIEEDPLSFPLGLTVKSAAATANITRADIFACNSVIHVVDAVMIPKVTLIPSKKVTVAKAVAASELYASLLPVKPKAATPTSKPASASG